MWKKIVCILIAMIMFCSGPCSEIAYAIEEEPVEIVNELEEAEVSEEPEISGEIEIPEEPDLPEDTEMPVDTELPEDSEESEPEVVVQEYFELKIEALKKLYELGDTVAVRPILTRYYVEENEQLEEVFESDKVSFDVICDQNELGRSKDTSVFEFVRKSTGKISFTVTAVFMDSTGAEQQLTKTYTINKLNYQISFKNLRESSSTWMYVDETKYPLELNVSNLQNKGKAKIVWEVIDKSTGKKLKAGFEKNTAGNILFLNGKTLNANGYAGKTLSVKASVFSGNIDTGVSKTANVVIRKTTAKLKNAIQGKYQLGKQWKYQTNITAYLENGSYLSGKDVSLSIKDIKSSNEKVLKVVCDKAKKNWTLNTLKTGVANVTFCLSKDGKEYKIVQKITVMCTHPVTVESLQVEKILTQAKQWLGRKESDGSHKLIIDVYNSHEPLAINYKVQYYDSWCATYVSAVSINTGYTTLIPTECGCERMINLFEKRGEWIEDENCTPKAGWIIFYDWNDNGKGNNKGWSDHVGIVEKVSDNVITVLEGNYDDKVKRRTIDVNGKYIRGYAVPEYGKEITRASTSKNGIIEEGCTLCEEGKKTTIYAASKISLAQTQYTYDEKVKMPEIIVKNSKGNKISKSEYTVSGSTAKKLLGNIAS